MCVLSYMVRSGPIETRGVYIMIFVIVAVLVFVGASLILGSLSWGPVIALIGVVLVVAGCVLLRYHFWRERLAKG